MDTVRPRPCYVWNQTVIPPQFGLYSGPPNQMKLNWPDMEKNIGVVIIEDTRKDVQRASRVLKQAGVTNPAVFTFVPAALMFLEDVVSGARSCPDLMILDLDFGTESGFEVLRFYKAHPKLKHVTS